MLGNICNLDKSAIEMSKPTIIGLFLPNDSISAKSRNKTAVICPKYQTDPTEDKYQIIEEKPISIPDQIARPFFFLIFNTSKIVRTTITAPIRCARYCCWKFARNKNTKGVVKKAGMGGFTKVNFC